jgi:hypothetical protein
MTTGRGLTADRLWAAGGLFGARDQAQGAYDTIERLVSVA